MKPIILSCNSSWCEETAIEIAKTFSVACRFKRTNQILIIADTNALSEEGISKELYLVEHMTTRMLSEKIFSWGKDSFVRHTNETQNKIFPDQLSFYFDDKIIPLIEIDLPAGSLKIYPTSLGLSELYIESFNDAVNLVDSQLDTVINQLLLVPEDAFQTTMIKAPCETSYAENQIPLVQYIAKAIETFPDNIAYIFEGRHLTYAELDQYSNVLAGELFENNVLKGDIVFIALDNSLELPISYLACMKVGAVFTPTDIRWPDIRYEKIVASIRPKAIIGNTGTNHSYEGIISIKADISGWQIKSVTTYPQMEMDADDLLYGFFTSGSTGLPKCTLNKQKGVVNRFNYMSKVFGIKPGKDVILQNSNIVFDSSIWQILWPLCEGCTIVIPQRKSYLDIDYTVQLIEDHKITMTDFVPSIFNLLVQKLESVPTMREKLRSVKNIIVGGEESQVQFIQRFYKECPWVVLVNTYGHTEASIGMIFYHIPPNIGGNEVPLGQPIDNTFVMILDENQRPVPAGFVGEFYVGGVCVGAGYYNDPERNERVFLSNPFNFMPGKKVFRTGDFGNLGNDGLLFYKGRNDEQIKIEGIRLDLKEIEAICLTYPQIEAAKVLFDSRRNKLTAFVTSSHNEPEELKHHLHKFLQARLPKHAVPALIAVLREFPLTENGKINIMRMKELIAAGTEDNRTANDSNEIRNRFKLALDRNDVSDKDNFFEAGGSSLSAIKLIMEIEHLLKIKIDIASIYSDFSIRNLVSLASGKEQENTEARQNHVVEMMATDYGKISAVCRRSVLNKTVNERAGVLLTGAGGYFGIHLLADLLNNSDKTIYCMMRIRDRDLAYTKIRERFTYFSLPLSNFDKNRVKIVSGDFRLENWGIDPVVLENMKNEIGVVIHNGAEVDLVKNYASLQDVNVKSLQFLLEFCTLNSIKQLHFISSVSIFSEKLFEYYDMVPDKILYDLNYVPGGGYSQSKWTAEKILTGARDSGLCVSIYRFGEIAPHTETGIANERSLLCMLIKSMVYLKCYPESDLQLDYFPADIAGRLVVKSVLEPAQNQDINMINLSGMSINKLAEMINETAGITLEKISYSSFRDRLEEATLGRIAAPEFLFSLKFMLPKVVEGPSTGDPMAQVFFNHLDKVSDVSLCRVLNKDRFKMNNMFRFILNVLKDSELTQVMEN